MTDANMHGKHEDDLNQLQRAFKQSVTAVMTPIWAVIHEAEAEGHRLAHQETAFEVARERGESPDPAEVERVSAAQAAIVRRLGRIETHIDTINKHVEEIRQAAEEALFNERVRQFEKQFGTTEGL